MHVLDDILRPGLNVVFCGTAVAAASAKRGHYYAGRGNKFWVLLHTAGFTPIQLRPEDDISLLDYGIGITDLVKDFSQSHDRGLDYGNAGKVAAHIEAASPRWVAFNGKTAGAAAAGALGHVKPSLGDQSWTIGTSRVFVLPSSSGANATAPFDGRPTKLEWWLELASLATRGVS